MGHNHKQGGQAQSNQETQPSFIVPDFQWPEISPQNQQHLIELLCSILSPIGLHRSNHCVPSKGKKDKKRKRAMAIPAPPIPSPPEISPFVIVGLNNIVRRLESLSHESKPQRNLDTAATSSSEEDLSAETNHFSAIFVISSLIPRTLQSFLPQLAYTSSKTHPELPPTRLVHLPNGYEARLCQALCLPRVSCVGILAGALQTKTIIALAQESVPEMKMSWLQ